MSDFTDKLRATKLPDTKVYSTDDLTIGNLVDKSFENDLEQLFQSELEKAKKEERDRVITYASIGRKKIDVHYICDVCKSIASEIESQKGKI